MSLFVLQQQTSIFVYVLYIFSLHFNTFTTILIVKLLFLNFIHSKRFQNFFMYHQTTICISPFEKRYFVMQKCSQALPALPRILHPYGEEIQHSEHGESLKSRINKEFCLL